jgi:hypothetical protein
MAQRRGRAQAVPASGDEYMLKNSFHFALGIALVTLLLATPRSALADCGMGYPMGSNCYPTPPGTSYQGTQSSSNCYSFAGGSMCYVNPGSTNVSPSYNPPASGAYGMYGNSNSYNNSGNYSSYGSNGNYSGRIYGRAYGNGYNPSYGNGYASGGNYTNYMRYRVRWGDSLRKIANHFGISLIALIAANRQILNPNLIFPGQVINLPSRYGQNGYYMQGQNSYRMPGQNSNHMQGQMYGQDGYSPFGYH